MEPIYIPRLLKAPNQTEKIEIEQMIEGLETLTPVRGTLLISHKGSYLEVVLKVETIMTLTCDRCLQNYNQRLQVDSTELIWLQKEPLEVESLPLEREVQLEELNETLSMTGYFEPETWVYEQLCLALPIRQLCSNNCQPPEYQKSDQAIPDSRWANLASIKDQLGN